MNYQQVLVIFGIYTLIIFQLYNYFCIPKSQNEMIKRDNSDLQLFSKQRSQFIKYYEQELFEIDEGCWELMTGDYNGIYFSSKVGEITFPDKIYTKYDNPPIRFSFLVRPVEAEIKFLLDGQEINSFEGKILLDRNSHNPRRYETLLKFKGSTNHILYRYKFSEIDFPPRNEHGKAPTVGVSTNLLKRKRVNGLNYNYILDTRKKDIETKLFLLNMVNLEI